MDKCLKPERFNADPHAPDSRRIWEHWHRTLRSYLNKVPNATEEDKLNILINLIDANVFEYIAEAATFDAAIVILRTIYIKPTNEVFARYRLATCKQGVSQSIDEYFQGLKRLSNDCHFVDVTGIQHKQEAIRDAFIAGVNSSSIRQKLLESDNFDMQHIFNKARSLDAAQRNSEEIGHHQGPEPNQFGQTAAITERSTTSETSAEVGVATIAEKRLTSTQKCFFCGNKRHARQNCPAKESTCFKCLKKGHFSKVCRSQIRNANNSNPEQCSALMPLSSSNVTESKLSMEIIVNGSSVNALIDTGSTKNHMSEAVVKRLKLKLNKCDTSVGLAIKGCSSHSIGKCKASINIHQRRYENVNFTVLNGLLTDVVLGQEFLQEHESIKIIFGGEQSSLTLSALTPLNTKSPPFLFEYMTDDCHPVTTKSRNYSKSDREFIIEETRRLLSEDIIEHSNSPWRAQVVITKNENHKRRMCVDYSQTVNKFTQLDGYPLPRMQDVVNEVSQYKFYSTLDLKSAYHQIELPEHSRIYTGFEANGKLYQFKRLPFGLKNAVPCFQRIIDDIIETNKCKGTYAYLDNITVGGRTMEEHNKNLQHFLLVAKQCNLTFNEKKCMYSTDTIDLLGYRISKGTLKPDPSRVKPLLDLPVPESTKALKRALGMFAYYARWIAKYSDKARPLIIATKFPLNEEASLAFEELKQSLAEVTLGIIDEDVPFTVETDASDVAVSATLNQNNRPVAFHSRTLTKSEMRHSSVEKEATAIVEAVRKWSHFLQGRHFNLITDQKSVAFMYDNGRHAKIKNDKILRWRMDLSEYDYDIVYRAGKENFAPDTLSRAYCASLTEDTLHKIHSSLCHPGVTRMNHFVKTKNLPYSLDEIRQMTARCRICAEVKPNYVKPTTTPLIKATQPFERLSIDFKGPLPSASKNYYMLTVVDEFSRFPFAFPCHNIESKTVIQCLNQLFSMFGLPSYVHSDRGRSFISSELVSYLNERGVSTSNSSIYNPRGNGQCERYNGIIWTAVKLALKSENLPISQWNVVLPDVLHSIRSLLCTATNTTPHERMFSYQRRSSVGTSVPGWLCYPGPVLLKRHVRASKHDPLVDEVELVHATPTYAKVRFPSGRESTVSLRDIAPIGQRQPLPDHEDMQQEISADKTNETTSSQSYSDDKTEPITSDNTGSENVHAESCADKPSCDRNNEQFEPRRSSRITRKPDRLSYF